MVEVVVGMAVLAVLLTVAVGGIVSSIGVTGSDRQRVRAASLAAQEVERVRSLMQTSPAAITAIAQPNGLQADGLHTVTSLTTTAFTVTSAPAVGGAVFNVVDSGAWQSASSYNALNMTVTISWPNMRGATPVVNNAVLTIQGTGGNGSSGTVVAVSTAAPSAPLPTATLPPTCSLQLGAAAVAVDSTVSAPGGTYTALWDNSQFNGLPLFSVYAQATGSNPCGTALIPFTYTGSSGIFTASLPYGTWVLTAKLADGTLMTESLTVNSSSTVAIPLVVADNCGGAPSVQYNVSSSLLGQIVGSVVTGSRASTSTCSVAVPSTTFTTLLGGLFTGPTAYGNWSFTAAASLLSGPVSASATVGSGTTTIHLNDSGCPSISAPVTFTANQSATIYGTTTSANLTSGTITATRAALGGCSATSQSISIGSSGVETATLPYGTWTFSVNGQSVAPSLGITATGALNQTLTTAASCSSTPTTVNITVKDASLLSTLTGTLRATMVGNGTLCQPAGASISTPLVLSILQGLLGLSTQMSLLPGTYTFSVDGHSGTNSPTTLTVPGSPTSLTLTVGS